MTQISISKSELKDLIKEAINELKNAYDKHNCGSDRVKIYVNEYGELYHTIQQANSFNQGHSEILRFEYSRPEYDTTQDMLDEAEFEGTIEEWDWDNFTCGEDYMNYVEELLDKAVENCREIEIELNEENN
jgi:hypothetical protein